MTAVGNACNPRTIGAKHNGMRAGTVAAVIVQCEFLSLLVKNETRRIGMEFRYSAFSVRRARHGDLPCIDVQTDGFQNKVGRLAIQAAPGPNAILLSAVRVEPGNRDDTPPSGVGLNPAG